MTKVRLSNKVIALIGCILTVVILLTSCAAPTAKTPSASNTSTEPKYGGTLRVGYATAPTNLDSFVVGVVPGATNGVIKTFAQTLVRWEGTSDRGATVAPLLAKSWEVSPDGYTWTFHLQEGVKYQNAAPMNGREFTADDVVYYTKRIMDPANKQASRSTLDAKSIEAVDKYTVKITNNSKSPGFLAYMAHGYYVPIPKEIVEAPGGADKNTVGTGAFTMSDYSRDTKAVLKKNPDYWEKGKPYLDSVELYFIPDASARLAAFRAGQLDVLPTEGKANKDAIEKSVPGVVIQDGVGLREAGLILNNKKPPLDNKLVRQALQYAIDYDGLIKAAMDGAAFRSGYLAPWFSEWGSKPVSALPARDIAKAKALLAQAGYPNGFQTTIMQNTGQMETFGNAVEPVAAMLKEVGIEAKIVPQDNASFLSKMRSGDYDMSIYTLYSARPFDPNNSVQQQWSSKSMANFMGYKNPKMDELILAQQDQYPNKEKRIGTVKQILSLLEDDVPSIPLYVSTNYFIKQPYVKGWDNMADPHMCYSSGALPYVWLSK